MGRTLRMTGIAFMSDILKRWKGLANIGLLAAAAVTATAGCAGRVVSGTVENKIEDSLPELIGPAKSYRVKVDGSAVRMARGKFREIDIHGEDVTMSPGLVVGKLDVHMEDVVADSKKNALTSIGRATFDASVSERSLNEYLSRTREDRMRVELLDHRMMVWAEPKILVTTVGVKLTGRLKPSGSKIDFAVDQLQVIGLNAPTIAKRAVEEKINPVMDLGHLQFTPEIEAVEMMPGVVRIKGTARLNGQGRA